MTASLAAAREISLDAAVAAVLSALDDIFPYKKNKRMSMRTFLGGKDAFALPLRGFWQEVTWDHNDPIVCAWCQIGETKKMSRAQLQLESKREMQRFCHSGGFGVNTA